MPSFLHVRVTYASVSVLRPGNEARRVPASFFQIGLRPRRLMEWQPCSIRWSIKSSRFFSSK